MDMSFPFNQARPFLLFQLPSGWSKRILFSMGPCGGSLARPKRLVCIFFCLMVTFYLFFLATLDGGIGGSGGASSTEVSRAMEARLARVMTELEQVRDQSNQIMFIAKQIR